MNKLVKILATATILPLGVSTIVGQVCFTPDPAKGYAIGSNRGDIKSADMNGDGQTDLVLCNFEGSSISVLKRSGTLPDGMPQFDEVNFPVGARPFFLYVNDIDGNGTSDIAVTNANDHSFTVLLNDGDLGMTAHTVQTGNEPTGIIGGHFNGDAYTDFAVSNWQDQTISIYYGTLAGTYLSGPTRSTAPYYPEGLAAGNFDGLAGLDIAVSVSWGNMAGYLFLVNEGLGQFSPPTPAVLFSDMQMLGGVSSTVDTADFNNDGITDLAFNVPEYQDQRFFVVRGNPTAFPGLGYQAVSLSSPQMVSSFNLVCADFNGDGNTDIAAALASGGIDSTRVLLGNGDMGFPVSKSLRAHFDNKPRGIVAADFNHDGKPDLATSNLISTSITDKKDLYLWLNTTPFIEVTGQRHVCGPAPVSVPLAIESPAALSYAWQAGAATGSGEAFTLTANAINNPFSVTAADGLGCTNKYFGKVRVHPLPLIEATAQPTTICKGDNVIISSTGNALNPTWVPAIPSQPFAPMATATYTVSGTNDLGCIATDSVTVVVNELPTVSLAVNGSSIEATASPSGVALQWLDCGNGNAEITGATAAIYTPAVSGVYAVNIISPQGCERVSDCIAVTVEDNTGNASVIEAEGAAWAVYPNPSDGPFFIETPPNAEQVIINDLLGKTVYEANINGNGGTMFVHLNQPAGIYSITIKTPATVYYRKIVLR